MFTQRKRAKERGANSERVDRRANVVDETRRGQIRGTNSPSQRGLRLINDNRATTLSDGNCSGKTVRSRADDYRVICVGVGHSTNASLRMQPNPKPQVWRP